ncbi:GLIPR1-like protein 1 isoform X2 [Pristis pectinata]|uniref:GLIPR1-like protein 1 isoform X2 n=1 Tax=Pristis pectinata TaxID=685728 RepID=UPI00223DDF25|nr:GLIPR1-like protein 1 isoform X2 [Pristis pectinata]
MAAVPRLLLALCAPLSVWAGERLHSVSDPTFIRDCVDEHNKYRSQVDPTASKMFKMTWDEALAKSAKAWGKKCRFKHNPNLKKNGAVHPTFFPVGENLYASTGRFEAKQAIKAWNDEVKDYNFQTNSCKKSAMCGHYTQIVWDTSYKLGCAVTECPNGLKGTGLKRSAKIFVCNYAPAHPGNLLWMPLLRSRGNVSTVSSSEFDASPLSQIPVKSQVLSPPFNGNIIGRGPYTSGATCSACTTCSDNLCTDPARDKLRKYPHWHPDFGSASISLHDQLIFLITIILIYILQ